MVVDLTDDEVRFLVSLLRSNAAFHASRFERREQMNAEVLIRKLKNKK